jgi:hypothetical protein
MDQRRQQIALHTESTTAIFLEATILQIPTDQHGPKRGLQEEQDYPHKEELSRGIGDSHQGGRSKRLEQIFELPTAWHIVGCCCVMEVNQRCEEATALGRICH